MTYLLLILSFSLIPFTQCTLEEDEVYLCANGWIWQCVVERVDEPATLNQIPHLLPPIPVRSSRRRKPPTIYFSYLNKVNPEDGSMYVAARLKVEIQQLVMVNATGMSLQILPKDPNLKPIYYHAQLAQRRPVPEGLFLDFTFPIENKLKYEQHYTLKFDLLPLHLGVSAKKQLLVQDYTLPEVDCNQQIDYDDRRQYITSRFTSAFRQLTFYPYHSTVNLSFYAAPRPYCLSYEVQLSLGGSHVIETHFIHGSDMQEYSNESSTLIGTVTLTKIRNDQNYSLRIIPYSATNSCVCFDCSCMLVESQTFVLPQIKASRVKPNTPRPNLSEKPSQSSVKQSLRIEIVDDRQANNHMLMLIVFFCLLSLTFISASLILLLCRNSNRPSALILVKSARISQRKPLLKNNQTILILNAEPAKKTVIEMLVEVLEANGQIRVVHAERGQKAIEKNLQSWCQDILLKADKIILFHSNRAACLLSHNRPALTNQSAIFDIAFQTLISLVRINDSRFIHACWDNQRVTLFHDMETVYVLPRDLHFFCTAMNVSPTIDQYTKLQDEYQKIIQPMEEITTELITPQPIQIEAGQTETSCPEPNNEPYDSGFITMSSIGEVDNKDIISVGSSEDSGLIL